MPSARLERSQPITRPIIARSMYSDQHGQMQVSMLPGTCASVTSPAVLAPADLVRISLKMIYDPPLPDGVSDLTEYVNSFLPDQIRMWGFVRTMKSFQART